MMCDQMDPVWLVCCRQTFFLHISSLLVSFKMPLKLSGFSVKVLDKSSQQEAIIKVPVPH